MVVDTKSVGSEPHSWVESLFLNESEVLKSCPIKQADIVVEALQHESFHKEQSNSDTELTFNSTSRDEDSYSWEEMFPDEKEEEEGGVPIVSGDDLGWQHQSSISSFSIYFDIEASCRVSVLDDESLDEESLNHNSECTEESCGDDLSFKPTFESESSSLASDVIETDEDSVQSAYEVKSVTNEMGDERVDCRWGPLNFAERMGRRKEKRSRIKDKMFGLGSSLSKLEYLQVEASSLTSEINEMDKDSVQSEHEVKSVKMEIGDKRGGVDYRWSTVDFAERVRRRKEKRSRIMAKMNHLDSLMKRDTDDFAERRRRRKEKRSRIMVKMFELGSSMSKLEYETS